MKFESVKNKIRTGDTVTKLSAIWSKSRNVRLEVEAPTTPTHPPTPTWAIYGTRVHKVEDDRDSDSDGDSEMDGCDYG